MRHRLQSYEILISGVGKFVVWKKMPLPFWLKVSVIQELVYRSLSLCLCLFQTMLTAISMSAIATNGVVPGKQNAVAPVCVCVLGGGCLCMPKGWLSWCSLWAVSHSTQYRSPVSWVQFLSFSDAHFCHYVSARKVSEEESEININS